MGANKKYRIGKVTFGTKEAKERWILEGILGNIEYVKNGTDLGVTEKELLKLSMKELKKLIKTKNNDIPI
jgi:hypothetical protein